MTPEVLNSRFPEIPWPNEVTSGHLVEITSYYAQGKSRSAAVAWVIIDEARKLFSQLQEKETPCLETADEIIKAQRTRLFRIPRLIEFYSLSAVIILETEQALRGNESIREEIISQITGEPLLRPIRVEQSELWQAILEAQKIITTAEYQTVLKTKGPLELVDFYITQRQQKLNKRLWPKDSAEALERGRQRFHQLYNAAQ